MIRKRGSSYVLVSHKGKQIGGPYKTRDAAVNRLRQIEYFKHKKK